MMRFHGLNQTFVFPLLTFATLASVSPGFAVENATDQEVDCPVAFEPYSSAKTTLLDFLLNPAAKAVVDRDLPGFFAKLPPIVTQPAPPTLADILTIRTLPSELAPIPAPVLDKLDKDLARVPVTREAAVTRCARYDHIPPVFPKDVRHPAILAFSKSNGFRDDPSVNAAAAALTKMAAQEHWSLFPTDNAAIFNSADLERFDAVVWNNVSGDVLTLPQRRDFEAYIEKGGGYAGLHGSGGRFLLRLGLVCRPSSRGAVQKPSHVAPVSDRHTEDS